MGETERAKGLDRVTREEIEKYNHMPFLRFHTWGKTHRRPQSLFKAWLRMVMTRIWGANYFVASQKRVLVF